MIRIHKNLSTKFSFLVNSLKILSLKKPNFLTNFSNFFTPHNCHLCDEITENNSLICNNCNVDLPKIQAHCSICCLPLTLEYTGITESNLVCGECLTHPPSFTTTICPFIYKFPIKQLIRRVKYNNQRYWVKALCQIFNDEYALSAKKLLRKYPDLLIPIPMHKSKYKERGFNQSELIAHTLSKQTGIKVSLNILIKTKPTVRQAQLNKKERMKNLRNSFQVTKKAIMKEKLKDKHVALIDDVMTTKATCELASALLLKYGAKQVDVWCLARTPKTKQY